jgi:hypothetical protein
MVPTIPIFKGLPWNELPAPLRELENYLTYINTHVGFSEYVINGNVAPYNMEPNNPAFDNSAALEQALADAVSYAIANDHIAILMLDPGEYYLTRPLQTVEPGTATVRYYAQVRLPFVVELTTPPIYLLITSKTVIGMAQPLGANPRGTVVFRSTLTAQTYSGTYGWPSMIGGPDEIHGYNDITKATWLCLHLRGVGFRQPQDPSMACINHANVDQTIIEDVRFDTVNTGFGAYHGPQPQYPTGIANLCSSLGLEGCQTRGNVEVHGYYGGYSIGELSQGGAVQVFRCRIGLVVRTMSVLSQIDYVFIYHCVTDVGSLHPVTGLTDATPNAGTNTLNVLRIGHLLTEEEHGRGVDGAQWNIHQHNLYDPTNVWTGMVCFQRNESGAGVMACPLFNVGARNVKCIPMIERLDGVVTIWDDFSLKPTESPGVSMNTRHTPAGSQWDTPAIAGVTDFILAERGITVNGPGASAREITDLGTGFNFSTQVSMTMHFVSVYPTIANPVVGFIFHYKDPTHYMQVAYNMDLASGGGIVFQENIGGVFTNYPIQIGGVPLYSGAVRELRLELWRQQAYLFLDGVQWASYTMSAGAIAEGLDTYGTCGPYMVEPQAWIIDFQLKRTVT